MALTILIRSDLVKKWLLILLTFLPIILILLVFSHLPNQIPAHYNFAGEVTRYGSKYELFIFPLLALLLSAFLAFMTRLEKEKNKKTMFGAHVIVLLVYTGLTIWTLINAWEQTENIYTLSPLATQIFSILLNIGLMIVGNYLPKCKPNLLLGIRTPWTLKSEQVWYQTHRFGGWFFVIGGLLLFALSFLLTIQSLWVTSLIILLTSSIIPCIYSYIIYKKRKQLN